MLLFAIKWLHRTSETCGTEQSCTEQYNRYLAENERRIQFLPPVSDSDDGYQNGGWQRLEEERLTVRETASNT